MDYRYNVSGDCFGVYFIIQRPVRDGLIFSLDFKEKSISRILFREIIKCGGYRYNYSTRFIQAKLAEVWGQTL